MSTNGRPAFTDEQVSAWAEALLADDVTLDALWIARRWTREALAQLGVGFDGERYTLPVRDDGNALIDVLRYAPAGLRDHGQPKTLATAGASRDLFPPPEQLDGTERWFFEGEPDAIVGTALGLPAVGVPGTGGWKSKWAVRFEGADVVIVFDCDKQGREAAQKIAADLVGVAASVRIIDLHPQRSDGFDLSDFVADAETVEELHQAAELLRTMAAQAPVIEAKPDRERETERQSGRRSVVLTPATVIRSERVRWLEPGRIPLRGLTVVPGEKGLGKSIYTNAYLAAEVSRGRLDGDLGDPAHVLVVTAEDDWRAIVKPRLEAHDADLDRVHRLTIHEDGIETLFTLPLDVEPLEAELERLRAKGSDVRLLVIDPIGAFLPEATKSTLDAPVRRALAPLAALADRWDLAVVVVAHLTKDETKRLIQRVQGAGAFVNAARSVLAFARDPNDPKGEQGLDRVIVHAAANWGSYAPTLSARIESRWIDTDDGEQTNVGYLVIGQETDLGVEDLQLGREDAAADCEEAIGAELAEGPKPSRQVKSAVVAELGCSRSTVDRAARRMRERGELTVEEGGFPRKTTWALVAEGEGK